MAAIEAKAVKDLADVEIDSVVNQRRLMHAAYSLSALVVVFCLYAALTPKSIVDSARRALLADVVRPTNTRLMNIKPGNDESLSTVVAGAHVEFSSEVQGTPPPNVKLHYSVDGGKFYAVSELTAGKNQYDSWKTTLRNVQQSMDYYLTGGDAESLKYHLEVLAAPMVTNVTLDYQFPEYTGIAPRLGIDGGSVEAIEGTMVTVHAKTNEPAQTGTLDFTDPEAQHAVMEVESGSAHELSGRFKVTKNGSYTIKFRTTGGQMNPDPVNYDINSIPDKSPTAQIVKPEQPLIKVPSNAKVPIVITASDDHGVRGVSSTPCTRKSGRTCSRPSICLRPSRRPAIFGERPNSIWPSAGSNRVKRSSTG